MDALHNFHPTCTDYDCDILDTLKEREVGRWKVSLPLSQIECRNSMVQMIRNIAEQHSYRRSSVHLAIYMFDLFMSHNCIVTERLNLVALTCFYVACKIEENEPKVPSPRRLCSFVENAYVPADIVLLEVTILKFFNWHVTIPTAATFLDFFALHSLQMDDFEVPANANLTKARFVEYKAEIINSSLEYLDVSLSYHKMSNVKPSLLAAACVAAARCLTLNVRAWNNHLTSVTGYSYDRIHGLCSMLVFELKPLLVASSSRALSRKRSVADSGYLSEADETGDSEDTYSANSNDDCSIGTSCSSGAHSKRSRITSSSSSSSDSGETCAKRQKVSYDLA